MAKTSLSHYFVEIDESCEKYAESFAQSEVLLYLNKLQNMMM